jgi:hypothetical protein
MSSSGRLSAEMMSIHRLTKRGKRSLHLIDTINAKKRWTTIYWHVNKFLRKSHIVTRLAKERESFLKIIDINDISFFGTPDLLLFYSVSGNANSMPLTLYPRRGRTATAYLLLFFSMTLKFTVYRDSNNMARQQSKNNIHSMILTNLH